MIYELTQEKLKELIAFESKRRHKSNDVYQKYQKFKSLDVLWWPGMFPEGSTKPSGAVSTLCEHVVENCIDNRRDSDDKLRRHLNNERLLEEIGGYTFPEYREDVYTSRPSLSLRDLTKLGDPLSKKVLATIQKLHMQGNNPDHAVALIVDRLNRRTMTEEEYMGYLNGEKAICRFWTMESATHGSEQPVFLNSDSEKGFSLGKSKRYRMAYAQNDAGP